MTKGWHNDRYQHSLAARGFNIYPSKGKLKQFHKRITDEDNIKSVVKSIFGSCDYLNLKGIEKRSETKNHLNIDFKVTGVDYKVNSSMSFDIGRNTLHGVVRLPIVTNNNQIKQLVNSTGAKTIGYTEKKIIDETDDTYKILFHGEKPKVVPHLHFDFENVKSSNLSEYIKAINTKVKDALNSGVYGND